ncbi:MAG: hypothetical protein AAF645_25505 [Myxococcota bacterium]
MPNAMTFALALSLFASAMAAPGVEAQDTAASERDDEARLRFEIARRANADGRYEEAYENFARAHELSGRHALLFNMGVVAERLRRDEDALAAYRRYLEEVPEAPNRRAVERRIDILQNAIDQNAEVPANDAEPPDIRPQTAAEHGLDEPAAGSSEPTEDEGGVATKWWFWTIVGVVVAGAGVGVGLALSGGGTTDPPSGFGPVIQALQ